jgi:uncharacterized Zn ribbon protein
MFIKIIAALLLVLLVTSGCNSSDSTTSDSLVKEFISLDKKANFENGNVMINEEATALSFAGGLLFRASVEEEYQGLGIGLFGENDFSPLALLSTEDGELPDYQEMEVNIPDSINGYSCNNITHQEKISTVIEEAKVFIVKGHNCIGKGDNAGLIKDISMKLTQSMFVGGTSHIDLSNGKAYINTEIQLNDNLLLSGGLGTRAYNQIFDLIVNNPEITTVVLGEISGSVHDDINMQTGRLIRKAELSTHVESTGDIASGGVDLFCSGKKRTTEEGAKFGVHSWSGDDVEAGNLPVDSPLHNDQITYFNEMLGSPIGKDFYFFTINAAPADGIYQMSNAELTSFGLLTE